MRAVPVTVVVRRDNPCQHPSAFQGFNGRAGSVEIVRHVQDAASQRRLDTVVRWIVCVITAEFHAPFAENEISVSGVKA